MIVGFSGEDLQDDTLLIQRLIEADNIKPVIDRIYPLQEIVDAHRSVDTGRKRGAVVLSIIISAAP